MKRNSINLNGHNTDLEICITDEKEEIVIVDIDMDANEDDCKWYYDILSIIWHHMIRVQSVPVVGTVIINDACDLEVTQIRIINHGTGILIYLKQI